MKIIKILLWVTMGLVAIGVITMGDSFAQQGSPPEIKVYLALDLKETRVPNQPLYFRDNLGTDLIKIVLTFINRGEDIITSKGFSATPFHLYLTFKDPDGNAIIAKKLMVVLKEDAPPPETIDVNGEPIQVEPVETLLGGNQRWTSSITIPNAHAFYTLSKGGRYSVKAIIPMRTYKQVNYPGSPENYSEIDDFKWSSDLQSNTVNFTLLVDADKDGYYVPEGYPAGALADCNDNDAKEKPGQTWYKDADNDGYSDGTTNTASCTRPIGYKVASELAAMTLDCNDGNSNVNPGRTEVACNGIDDDCNPATPDFPAPTLASPADGATNVPVTPTFTWSTVSCAASYGLQVATDPQFSSVVINQQSLTTTSFTVTTPPLLNNTTYYWHVNAKKDAQTSDWSIPWSFTTTAAPPTKSVRPVLECVVQNSPTSYTAWFGYLNENAVPVTIPVGPNNKFTPTPQNRGQTTVFQPGRIRYAFSVEFNGNNLVWTLKGPDGKGRTSTASRNSARCK